MKKAKARYKKRGRPCFFDEKGESQLLQVLEENPEASLRELGPLWKKRFGEGFKSPSRSTVQGVLLKHGYRYQKTEHCAVWTKEPDTRYEQKHRPPCNRTSYPSDLTEKEWSLIQPLVERPGARGPKPKDTRCLVNAMIYVARTGCQWRYLPKDFPPWNTVAQTFYRWSKAGLFERIHDALREQNRAALKRESGPSMVILDSQSVKTTEKGGLKASMQEKKSKGESVISLSIRKVSSVR